MADQLIVASVQQRMHLPLSLEEYREDLRRFLRVARGKHARLVVFPELAGMMVAPPILDDFRSNLLKYADRGERRQATFWQRMVGRAAGSMAIFLRADFRRGAAALLDVAAEHFADTYAEIFSGLAREFEVTLVAPSAYLPDPVDGVIRNLTMVFDSRGEMVGRQAKVVLHPEDRDLAQPGSTWDVIATEVGQVGLILGSDVLFPEVGRVLAYQGAEILVMQAACADMMLYNKLRAAMLARMQDNQIFAAAAFLVGDNRFSRAQRDRFVGRSAIFAPQELTPRGNGVLVEMSNVRSEGVLTTPWDFPALRKLWEESDTPVRQQLPLQQAGQVLAQLYSRLQALPQQADESTLRRVPEAPGRAYMPSQDLDDLPVIGSISQRWPPSQIQTAPRSGGASGRAGPDIVDEMHMELDFVEGAEGTRIEQAQQAPTAESSTAEENDPPSSEDETDEMDIVPDRDMRQGDRSGSE